jgi:hypothetical protein
MAVPNGASAPNKCTCYEAKDNGPLQEINKPGDKDAAAYPTQTPQEYERVRRNPQEFEIVRTG